MSRAIKGLANSLVPHAKNQYKPHLIQHYGLAVVLVVLLAVQITYNYTSAGQFKVLGYATNVTRNGLLDYTNINRANYNLDPYVMNESLNQAAQAKATHMVENDYWSHYGPNGSTPWNFIDQSNYEYIKAGENLAYGFIDSSGTVQGWMDSPAHKANILDAEFIEVGFGYVNDPEFQGNENTVVVAMYGTPVTSSAISSNIESNDTTNRPDTKPAKWDKQELEQTLNQNSVIDDTVTANGVGRITNFAALMSGNAPWAMYISVGALLLLGIVYASRHGVAIYQFVSNGEHYIKGHPLLEAGLIYGLIWLILAATYGVIG